MTKSDVVQVERRQTRSGRPFADITNRSTGANEKVENNSKKRKSISANSNTEEYSKRKAVEKTTDVVASSSSSSSLSMPVPSTGSNDSLKKDSNIKETVNPICSAASKNQKEKAVIPAAANSSPSSQVVEQPLQNGNSEVETQLPSEVVPIRRSRSSKSMYNKTCEPDQCLEVIDEMYDVYQELQCKYIPGNYMTEVQRNISIKMRGILVDWLVEVHHKMRLQAPSLWLCINILDRYLAKVSILKSNLQLVGVTALFIACKFEEIYPPEVRSCVILTDGAYTVEEIFTMESHILNILNWDISIPTAYHFITRYLNCIRASTRTRNLAFYYAERNLQEENILSCVPSHFAAAAVYSALKQQNTQYYQMRNISCWPTKLIEESGLGEFQLLPTAIKMIKHVGEEPLTSQRRKLISCKKKYMSPAYEGIANLVLPEFESTV